MKWVNSKRIIQHRERGWDRSDNTLNANIVKIKFDKVTPDDLNQVAKLQPDGWSDITAEFRFFLSNSYCNPIKMIVDNEIVGVGNTITFKNSAWLAHIVVGVKNRNKGYGFHIVEYLLNDLKCKAIDTISLIASPFGEPVYKKFGFRTVSNYIYLERNEAWIEKEIKDRIVLYERRFYPEIIRLDKKISGEDREPLLRGSIENSFVYIENEEVRGYYISTLGEGQIFAETAESGLELMAMKYAKIDIAVLPENNEVGLEFLKQNGFCESPTRGKRMILGEDLNWQPTKYFSRINGDYG